MIVQTSGPTPQPNPEVSGLLSSLQELQSGAETLRANYTAEVTALADRLCIYGHPGNHDTPKDIDELSEQYVELMSNGIDFCRFTDSLYRAGGFARDLSRNARLWLDNRLASWDHTAFCTFCNEKHKIQLTSLHLDLRWCQLLSAAGLAREDGEMRVDRKALTDLKSEQRTTLMNMFVTWCNDQIDVVQHLHTLVNTPFS